MTKTLIKPFAKPGYTMVNNAILDHIMPDLSGSGWKILCVAIRQTIGWVDDETESGRKESDRISYSQFMEKSGIKSSRTVSKAIKECLSKTYLLRLPSADHQQGFDYSLNRDFEMEIETTVETGSISEPVSPKTSLESKEVSPKTSLESKEVTPQKPLYKVKTQKKGVKQRDKERGGTAASAKKRRRRGGRTKYAEFIDH